MANSRTAAYALAILLVVVSGTFSYYYVQTQSAISQKDRDLNVLRSTLTAETANATRLEAENADLQANILNLTNQIYTLRDRQTASGVQVGSLERQLAALRNESALLNIELGIIYHVVTVSVSPLFVNNSVSIAPRSNSTVASGSSGPNWTLAFLSAAGCRVASIRVVQSQPEVIGIVFNSSAPLVTSYYASIGPQPWSLQLQNEGGASVACTFSAYYVYNT